MNLDTAYNLARERNGLCDEKTSLEVGDFVSYEEEDYEIIEILPNDWCRIQELHPEDDEPLQRRVKLSSLTEL